ncbi:MAG: YggS family pyridoxal phosphate-dependent enzyme [Firmicutes bacterium HGW-Firmicutes-11]|jgi:hypothetical protein|nr:MAG: YggS family pyridoxal phosphate-dependent enzyme [Firmicutes bacterium HGW-Firmicutes-11]
MSHIADNIREIKEIIKSAEQRSEGRSSDVLLVAVTKTRSAEEINRAIEAGITDIGENRVQEITEKHDKVAPVRWHMIGHLQTNKVKYIIDKVCMIHSVDSLKLAAEIDRRAGEHGITMDILVQVNAAGEESKFGLGTQEARQLAADILDQCPNLRIRGLMSIVPFEDDPEMVRIYFRMVRELFETLKETSHPRLDLKWLSMGMSNDYKVAIEEGSNLVRIGTAIFGER